MAAETVVVQAFRPDPAETVVVQAFRPAVSGRPEGLHYFRTIPSHATSRPALEFEVRSNRTTAYEPVHSQQAASHHAGDAATAASSEHSPDARGARASARDRHPSRRRAARHPRPA